MINAVDIRKGMNIIVGGKLYVVLDRQHHKPGKGGAVMRTKIKNLDTGAITERTFRGGDKIEETYLERKKHQYLYSDKNGCFFMNMETYEQISLSKEQLGKSVGFLKENMDVNILMHVDRIIGVDLPKNIVLKVTYAEPGHRGDTATNVQKQATVETGIEVQVPLFINIGDSIVINVETGKYVSRN